MVEITTTIYRAYDGTKFDNEIDCHEYEWTTTGLKAWNDECEQLDYYSVSHAQYVYCPTKESIAIFRDSCDFSDWYFDKMDKEGLYVCDENLEAYVPFDTKIKDLENDLKSLNNTKNKLLKNS